MMAGWSVAFARVATNNMRHCMILPITDNVEGAISYQVHEEVEKYLKESRWCYYRYNSEILSILQNYRKKLSEYIINKEVLRLIAEKSRAGSLLYVTLNASAKGVDVGVTVFGESGEDIYFKESTQLNVKDTSIISQTVMNWLDLYSKTIPYSGSVMGMSGDRFTVDVGRDAGVLAGNGLEIVRPVKIKRHPLLKEIVEWDVERIAQAKITDVTEGQAQAVITVRYDGKSMEAGDWVRVNSSEVQKEEEAEFIKKQDVTYGKIGSLSMALHGSLLANKVILDQSTTKNVSSFGAGVSGQGEMWLTRNIIGVLAVSRKFATAPSGAGSFILKGGYRFLPLGFFFGPQVDAYLGYGQYAYTIDTDAAKGFVGSTYGGLLLGTKVNVPVYQGIRAFVGLDFIFSPSYQEDVVVHGTADATSHYVIDVGGSYAYGPTILLDLSILMQSSSANFKDPAKKITLSDTSLKLGFTINF